MKHSLLMLCALAAPLLGCQATGTSGIVAIMAPGPACQVARDGRPYVGRTISFRGDYTSDRIERARARPPGCDTGFKVGSIASGLDRKMDPHVLPGFYPGRYIQAVFVGELVQGPARGGQFQDDDGVRLNIVEVHDIRPTKHSRSRY